MKKPEPVIEIKNLHKSFGDLGVLKGVDIVANKGEVISLIGSSGSGKSTLLRCANLLENSQQGKIFFDGEEIKWRGTGEDRTPADANQVRLMRTNLSMVFQQFNLFPHLTVMENCILAPMENLHLSEAEASKLAMSFLERVQIPDQANKLPGQLSGGQQQRIALARALVFEPELVLMDEPLGALDKQLREKMQFEITALAHRLGITVVYVTHDQTEALTMSDRVAVFNDCLLYTSPSPRDS